MKALRLGLASAATLAAMMMSLPADAQDARRPAPKVQPRRPARAQPPKPPPPKKQPSSASDDETTPETPADDVAGEAEPPPETAAPEDDVADEAAATEAEAAAELGPEDAVSPDTAADDEVSPEELEPPKKRPERRAGKRPRRRRPPPAAAATGAKRERPYELEYIEGMDVPDGYMLVDRTRTGLVVAGAVTFGVGWLAAVTAAVASSGERYEGCFGGGYDGGRHEEEVAFSCVEGAEREDFVPLYIPIAGPFIAMGTLEHAEGGMRAGLLLDGVAQVGGAAMFIAGLAAKRTVLVRTEHASMTVAPGPGSLQIFGSF